AAVDRLADHPDTRVHVRDLSEYLVVLGAGGVVDHQQFPVLPGLLDDRAYRGDRFGAGTERRHDDRDQWARPRCAGDARPEPVEWWCARRREGDRCYALADEISVEQVEPRDR